MAVLAPGIVVDKFRVIERIGAGAMGEVFLAVDDSLGRNVALKILADGHRNNPELRARFVREARAVAAISHPNVVQVFATGEWDGKPYIAMEFLSGLDFGHLVRERGPLDSATIARAIRDSAAGLGAAARAGLIHRDVKPSNLMLLDDGSVKVTDFGLAKPVKTGDDPALTAMGVVVGTPDYIAPEQARGEPIDSRVDVYALGCTMFFLFTGRPPYRKSVDDPEKYLKVVARHLREPAPDPRTEMKGSGIQPDDELVELQFAMMAKSAEDRPSYEVLVARLERIRIRLTGGPGQATSSPPPAANSADEARARAKRSRRTTDPSFAAVPGESSSDAAGSSAGSAVSRIGSLDLSRPRRARWLVAVTVIAALLFVVGLGLRLLGPLPARAPAATPPPRDGGIGVNLVGSEADAAVARPLEPPPGMLLVTDARGNPLIFVDRAPVTNAAYGEYLKTHRFAKKEAARPVAGVSFDYAAQYAQFRGKRLLRAEEWRAALETANFVPGGMRLWEWIDDGDNAHADRAVRRVNDGQGRRKSGGAPDITFRLAQDLPSR